MTTITSLALAAALLGIVPPGPWVPPDVPEVAEAPAPLSVPALIRDRAAAHGVGHLSEALVRLARCESGFDAAAVGDHGTSHGLVQLNQRGLLPHYLAQGYGSPYDAFGSIDYLARVLAGHWPGVTMRAWSCWGR